MRGEKKNSYTLNWTVHSDWNWANPKYSFSLNKEKNTIKAVIIDPSGLMADVDKQNNYYVPKEK